MVLFIYTYTHTIKREQMGEGQTEGKTVSIKMMEDCGGGTETQHDPERPATFISAPKQQFHRCRLSLTYHAVLSFTTFSVHVLYFTHIKCT